MDFSQLPYELQFDYLIDLPYRDVVHYCERDFGIAGYITGDDPVLAYAHLEEAYRLHPEGLLPHLIRTGQMNKFRELLPRAKFYRVTKNGNDSQYNIDPSYWDTINSIFDTQNRTALIEIITTLDLEDSGVQAFLLGPVLDRAIENRLEEWIRIIVEYGYPGDDIYQFYLDSIRNVDVPTINYFLSKIDPTVGGWEEVYHAFLSENEDIINYFISRYPNVISNRDDSDELVQSLITNGTPRSLMEVLARILYTKDDLARWIEYARDPVHDPEMVKVLEGYKERF